MKIAFTYNLKPKNIDGSNPDAELYAEFDSPETIEGIKKAIEANSHEVLMVEANEDTYEVLRKNRDKIDLIFNFAEAITNTEDREAQVPMMAEILRIPYTGPRPMMAAIILDKAMTKVAWVYGGVKTAPFQVFFNGKEEINKRLVFPLIVKPNSEGSSQGIKNNAVVANEKELRERVAEVLEKFKHPVLAEEFLPGREFTVSVIGNGNELLTLPIIEFNYQDLEKGVNKIDSYEAKWMWNHPANKIEENSNCPAKVDKKLEKKITDLAKKAFLTVECRDWGRVDIRLNKEGEPVALEINCPAGLQPNPKIHSCMPIAAWAAGWSFEKLVGEIILTAAKRYRLSK